MEWVKSAPMPVIRQTSLDELSTYELRTLRDTLRYEVVKHHDFDAAEELELVIEALSARR